MGKLKEFWVGNWHLILILIFPVIFFYRFFLYGFIPMPADTIVGMYHPYRDFISKDYPSGYPYKNYLITDPVRQQYIWRKLGMDSLKSMRLPIWNPYSFSGYPLHANFQTGVFYPLNLLYLIPFLPFHTIWSLQIFLQPVLAGIFLFFYLRETGASKEAGFIGSLSFSFSGFFISWIQWNTVIQTALWLPLILLAVEKILADKADKRKMIIWYFIFISGNVFSFFAGHLQLYFYLLMMTLVYIAYRLTISQRKKYVISLFVLSYLVIAILTFIQWYPSIRFIGQSARTLDRNLLSNPGWFIPWQHVIQVAIPDFFGNPATGNYWGVWNYAEFIFYIGIPSLIFSIYSLIFIWDKKSLLYKAVFLSGLALATSNGISRLPYRFQIPLISTSQPTRLVFLITFALVMLSAAGVDRLLKRQISLRQLRLTAAVFTPVLLLFALLMLYPQMTDSGDLIANISVARRNCVIPLFLLVITFLFSIIYLRVRRFPKGLFIVIITMIISADLFRQGWKFLPFSEAEHLYPETQIIKSVKKDIGYGRIMSLDRRIMAPNFSAYHGFFDVSGYDPLYLKDYAVFVSSWNEGKAQKETGSFNRIITPQNYQSRITDFLGVRYILSLEELDEGKLELIGKEGDTYLYLNKEAYPRVFLVNRLVKSSGGYDGLDKFFTLHKEAFSTAVSDSDVRLNETEISADEYALIKYYSSDRIIIETNTKAQRLAVLTDIYYPSWKAYLDGDKTTIIKVDYIFRGILVPEGRHKIEMFTSLL